MEISLSDEDILRVLPRAKFTPYNKLIYINDIRDLLGNDGVGIILYLTSDHYGHWTTIFLRDGKLSYFNSYGYSPDDDFRFIKPSVRIEENEIKPILFELIAKSGYICEYNNHCLQKHGSDIDTCGRHVISRIFNRHLDPNEYAKRLKHVAKINNMTTDELVVEMTRPYLGK